MASGSQMASQARKSRTSIALLIFSAASIYYSTQIYLNYILTGWVLLIPGLIAGAGIAFFMIALYLMYQDYQYESKYRDLRKREKRADVKSKEAEIKEIKEANMEIQADQAKAKQEEGETANIVEEGRAL